MASKRVVTDDCRDKPEDLGFPAVEEVKVSVSD